MRTIAALRVTSLIAAAALAGCGGGGGGSGGGGGGGGGATNPAAFAFNDSNAVAASALALRIIEHAALVAELPLVAAIELDERGLAQFQLACGGTFVELRQTDTDGNRSVTGGDSVSAEHRAPCAGLSSSKISMRLTAVDLSRFRIEGSAEFDIESAAGDRMVGTLSLATSIDSTSGQFVYSLTNLALTSARGGTTERLSGARFERRFDSVDNYLFDFAGQLDSQSLGGQYSFSTPARFRGTVGSLPDLGELVFVAGRTKLRFSIHPVPLQRQSLVDYELDTGSGYGPRNPIRWRELTTGLLFYWIPNEPPVISSLEVLPADAASGSVVTAYAAATDPDGDALSFSFSWTVGPSTYTGLGPTFSLAGVSKGDPVSVAVRVSDGLAEATTSTSFTVGNAAPVISSLTLDPPAPRAIDDLAVTAELEDVDGDTLAVRYEWQRNGASIPGATGTVLPRSAYAKNDVVTAIAYVDDGSATVSRQVSVAIADSPLQLTWLSPPVTVAHGAQLSARAVAADPDGDEFPPDLRFELRYGPAGMTVDPTTGAVSWLAAGPMFDRAVNVRYGVGTNVQGVALLSGEVVVEDPDREYPLARSSLEPGRYYSGLRAGDFDGDGDAEMLMLTEGGVLYELEAAGTGYRQAWMYPFSLNPLPLAIATADVDGDGAHEIFVGSGDRLLRLDGVARRVTASATLPVPAYFPACADLETADLDGDGTLEVVCSVTLYGSPDAAANHPLLVFDAATLALERQTGDGYFGNDLAIGNVDNDPALELVTGRGYVIDGVTLQQEWESDETFPGVAVGDVTGDGVAEIVTSYPSDDFTSSGRVYSALTRDALFDLPHLGFTTNIVANIDGAGRAEILMAGGRLAAYRYEPTGSVSTLFSLTLPNDRAAVTFAIANVDGAQDARPELIMGTNLKTIDIADWPATGIRIEWSSADLEPAIPQTLSGPFFGGELVRSPAHAPEPLFMTPATGFRGARLFSMDPGNGDLTFAPEIEPGESWRDPGDLAVTDFDNDGTDEAFITVEDRQDAAVGAYDFFAGQLTFRSPVLPDGPAVDVDHGDFNGDGRDDLVALTENGWLRVFDVFAGGGLLWSQAIPAGGRALVVADLDGAGPPEIIATTSQQVLVFSRESASEPFFLQYESGLFDYVGDMTAGDVDGDGFVDIFLVFDSPRIVQRFNHRLEPGARFGIGWDATSLSIEASAFGRKNLMATFWEPAGSQLRILDPVRGEEIWRSPPIHGAFTPNSIHFVDVAGDSELRIAYGTFNTAYLTR